MCSFFVYRNKKATFILSHWQGVAKAAWGQGMGMDEKLRPHKIGCN